MKKLLTTMSAVAMAMSLFAADDGALSGTNFEVPDVGTYNIEEPTGELTPLAASTTYWETNSTATLTIESGRPNVTTRPAAFDEDETQDKYLSIKTTLGNPVSRYVNTNKTAQSIGNGLYFDSLVKFTVFDSDPTIASENPKLAIWLKESEDSSSTNLMITAGYLSDASTVVVTNYSCNVLNNVDIYDGGWHRVTVKMISNILASDDAPGFVVFVDREKVVCPDSSKFATGISLETGASFFDAEGSLFPSAMLGSTAGMITAVDFDGQGSVDDIVFTTKAPDFAEDKDFFTIALDENVTSVPYTLYKGDGTPVASNTLTKTTSIVLPATGYYFTLGEIVYATGYMDGGKTGIMPDGNDNYSPTANSTLTISAAQAGAYIGDTPYLSLADAVAEANRASSDCTVKLAADATAGVTFENDTSGVVITLDLAGHTITNAAGGVTTVLVDAGKVVITNSTPTVGSVKAAVQGNGLLGNAVAVSDGTATIQAGIYDGKVVDVDIAGGSFLATYGNQIVNLKGTLDNYIVDAEHYEATLADNYYTLTEKAPTYKVVYVYGQDGEFAVTNDNLASGDTTPAAPAEAAITGYTLTWTPEVAATVTADATYTATYTPINYTITFVDGETSTPVTKAYGTTIETTDVPSFAGKTGYTAAWNEEPVGETVTGDKTYTAVYTAIEYTITYKDNEGVAFAASDWATGTTIPTVFTVANVVTLPVAADIARTDVTFNGWTNSVGTTVTTTEGLTANLEVFANFTAVVPTTPEIKPGSNVISVEVTANSEADAIADVSVVPPEGSGAAVADYTALFTITATAAGAGKYTVAITGIKESVVTGVDTSAVSLLTSGEGTIAVPAGLYYKITTSTDLPISGEATSALSTGSVSIEKPGTTKGFFKIELGATPFAN